ncbi:hypothetical protein NDU88_004074 [Pleurodeles waltl]|uniref:Uncharacterized protein n=1 Tax=Pleurodeles waltl TaxID=8319 RepID=A0AAV7RFN2_PLEWA|nr:hypothetical protein NDU88_004074 [Pleurodeles waltl]
MAFSADPGPGPWTLGSCRGCQSTVLCWASGTLEHAHSPRGQRRVFLPAPLQPQARLPTTTTSVGAQAELGKGWRMAAPLRWPERKPSGPHKLQSLPGGWLDADRRSPRSEQTPLRYARNKADRPHLPIVGLETPPP